MVKLIKPIKSLDTMIFISYFTKIKYLPLDFHETMHFITALSILVLCEKLSAVKVCFVLIDLITDIFINDLEELL